jgi:hypothetical protein
MTKCKVVKDQVVLYEDNVMYVQSVSNSLDEAISEVKKFLDFEDSIISFESFMNEIECSEFKYSKCFLHLVSQEQIDRVSQHCPLIVTINDEFLIYEKEEIIQVLQEIIEYQTSNDIEVYQEHLDTLNTLLN